MFRNSSANTPFDSFFFPLGVEFQLAVLSIAKLFDFTQDLQKEILER